MTKLIIPEYPDPHSDVCTQCVPTNSDTTAGFHVACMLVSCVVDHGNGYVDHGGLVADLRLITISQTFRLISPFRIYTIFICRLDTIQTSAQVLCIYSGYPLL